MTKAGGAVRTIIVTGGVGFIGSALVRALVAGTEATVVNVDALTYAANLESLGEARRSARHVFERIDVRDRPALERIFRDYEPDAVVHLAAETHVDRSIDAPDAFVRTNVQGTLSLLQAACAYWTRADAERRKAFRLLHVSTDEVYGDLGPDEPPIVEGARYAPSSPYSASKAAADHLVRAWRRTYGLPALIAVCCNNYGPCQYPEKLIPLMILNALDGKPLPVYGDGRNVRDWLYVEDQAQALRVMLERGEPGRTYHVAAGDPRTNIDVVRAICALLDEMKPRAGGSYAELIRFVRDRPGHDRRYALDDTRLRTELGWRPAEPFESGLRKTVTWYLDHPDWVAGVRDAEYRRWIARQYSEAEARE